MPTKFVVLSNQTKKLINVTCITRVYVDERDKIVAVGADKIGDQKSMVLTRQPLILLSNDMDTIERGIHKALYKYVSKQALSGMVNGTLQLLRKSVSSSLFSDSQGDLINGLMCELAEEYASTKDPFILEHFSGALNNKHAEILLKWWLKQRSLRQLYVFGFTLKEIKSCGMRPSVIFNTILKNPYILAPISVDKCRDVLQICGKTATQDQEYCGALLRFVYNKLKGNHWTYVPLDMIKQSFANFEEYERILEEEYDVIFDRNTGRVYINRCLKEELYVIDSINKMITTPVNRSDTVISEMVNKSRELLSEDQVEAVSLILRNGFNIVTGPAGSGKTTLLSTMVDLLTTGQNALDSIILIVAFTGKAVHRIKEVVGDIGVNVIISTIDRFVSKFNSQIPKIGHVFIDETSMVNIPLLASLLKCFNDYPEGSKPSFTLIGDPYQLPPINWGAVFDDLIASKRIPHKELTVIHRTANKEDNGIFMNCQELRKDPSEPIEIKEYPNFRILEGSMEDIRGIVKSLLGMGKQLKDMVILCPFNEYIDDLNAIMKSFLPKDAAAHDCINKKPKEWRVGDRVMLTKNNYEINVMNGDEGYIRSVGYDNIVVEFMICGVPQSFEFGLALTGNEDITFDDDSFSGDLTIQFLMHSFAISIHKSQGSQYPFVIGYFPEKGSTNFVNKKLVYTFMGRAQRGIFVMGNTSLFYTGAVTPPATPYSCFRERLIGDEPPPLEEDIKTALQNFDF
jgi:exodeoxyribonuclease V alpha subunit